MSNGEHKWTALAWGAVGVAFFLGGGFGGCNGTNYNDLKIASIQAEAAITIAKERNINVESRLLVLERYHRSDTEKTLERIAGGQ